MEFVAITGRAHQLRVHAADPVYRGPPGAVARELNGMEGRRRGLGHPILGDPLYGDPESAPRLMLHAGWISFTHPSTGERVEVTSTVPF